MQRTLHAPLRFKHSKTPPPQATSCAHLLWFLKNQVQAHAHWLFPVDPVPLASSATTTQSCVPIPIVEVKRLQNSLHSTTHKKHTTPPCHSPATCRSSIPEKNLPPTSSPPCQRMPKPHSSASASSATVLTSGTLPTSIKNVPSVA